MLRPKEFLEYELDNITLSLKESLRHEYGTLRSNDFYEECLFRLKIVKHQLSKAKNNNYKMLSALALQLSNLSELVTRIERSHLGEFSWSFANALESVATRACFGELSDDNETFKRPLFFISADGGLSAYRIHPEQEKTDIVERMIFNIAFPRSLKYHVLLHAILGHELGHAAWTIPDLGKQFEERVINPLFENSKLSTVEKFKIWLKKNGNIRENINDRVANKVLENWKEEFFCDLFGLLLIGPSFVAAHRSLLSSLDPIGKEYGNKHPPNLSRFWLVDTAVNALCMDSIPKKASQDFKVAVSNFWESMKPSTSYPQWSKIFQKDHIANSVSELAVILNRNKNTTFELAQLPVLEEIYYRLCQAIPPIRKSVNGSEKVSLQSLDFRDILYIGWLVCHTKPDKRSKLPFIDINRLCDRAILLQQSVDIELAGLEKKAEKHEGRKKEI